MKLRFTYVAAFAAAHLVLAVCGATHIRLIGTDNLLGKALATYAAASGADAGFAFFAPRVAPQFKAEFVLSDETGKTWTDDGDWARNQEVRLRMSSVITMVSHDEIRDGMAASWAAAMFGKHPTATHLEMRIFWQDMPNFEQYREGCRPIWRPMYESKFERGSPEPDADQPASADEPEMDDEPPVTNDGIVRPGSPDVI